MKYSKEQLENLTYKDYILLMAEELNNNGFTNNGEKYKVSTDVNGNFVSDFFRGFVLSMKDPKATEFLKTIGLLNNGRCPLTGLMISSTKKMIFTSEYNSSISYEISSTWQEYTKVKRNWGCFFSIPIIVIGGIWGIVNGFNIYAISIICLGIVLAIFSFGYAGSKIGNNWNVLCLSNEIGINTVTLFYILKIEKSGDELNYQTASQNDIPSADLEAYMKWRNV